MDELVSIFGGCVEYCLPVRSWQFMLALAERYGWQPRGTEPPEEDATEGGLWHDDWDGRYVPICGQSVTEQDARALADALERALRDIPGHDALTGEVETGPNPWRWFDTASVRAEVNVLETIRGESIKDVLEMFIEHFREDGGLLLV